LEVEKVRRLKRWHLSISIELPESIQPSPGTIWAPDQTLTANGYATGTGPSYTYAVENPVAITNLDKAASRFAQNNYPYAPVLGPNSNSLAWSALDDCGANPQFPERAFGAGWMSTDPSL
jgi:hypothetical protein